MTARTERGQHEVAGRRFEVIVVGGGSAGLGGALTLARARRSVLVIDAGTPRNAPADGVHGYLGREGIPPLELVAKGRAEVARYGGEIVTATVTHAGRDPEGKGFRVVLGGQTDSGQTDSGQTGSGQTDSGGADSGGAGDGVVDGGDVVFADRLLVTTGLVDEIPEVPGLAERWGREVLHCPYCHGWEVRDQSIGVLATGPLAVHQALMWRQWSDDVTLFLHTGPEPSEEEYEQLAAREIAVVDGEVGGLRVQDDRLEGVTLVGGRTFPCGALVVAPYFAARSGVLRGLGLEAVPLEMGGHVMGTYIPAGADGSTEVAGVWAAGNVTSLTEQAIGAAAAGVRAAASINSDLIARDTRDAVEARRAPFSAQAEREACARVLGNRRHGV
ncbi:NAD(P)/FAD-dependent oxidoreductase [Streptomyces tsukubensis]|uniref:Thioredoxin reductase n=1 Tax=Streptomyces tsukubensis TaxID=83656 RepID=A0A1V4A273_9ACTN|nr:NAD(P)/FAD-dependent oxidoreductase [Streptomyces tsukubensis]OON72551.1 thioredoxin reductase [Streptomyces tsukubensis]QFR93643.1 FAD-binding protein [Streptomyces tsukubensis]